MKTILKKEAHRKLLEHHGVIAKELRSRWRHCRGRTIQSMEAMLDLIIRSDSWEDRTSKSY